MINVAVTSILGFGFWIAAARLFSSEELGRGSALVSAMIFVSVVCQLNLGSAILRFLPATKLAADHAIFAAYGSTLLASLVGGIAFVVVAPILSSEYQYLADDITLAALFVVATLIWGIFALQDSVLTALRQATWVPIENGIYAALKIIVLPVLLAIGVTEPVFVAWAIPMVLLILPINYLIFLRFIPARPVARDELSPVEHFGWSGLRRFMAQDYLASILIQGSTTLIPVIVLAVLGSTQSAYFYIPFTIVGAFDLLFVKVSASFTVESALNSRAMASLVHQTVHGFGYLVVAGTVFIVAAAPLALKPFGAQYVASGTTVLRLMACASLFRAAVALYCAVCRVEGRAFRVLAVQSATFVLTVGLTYLLATTNGLAGVGWAWLIANVLAACAVVSKLRGLLREGAATRLSST